MKSKLKHFLPIVLICSMLFGSVSFASSPSGLKFNWYDYLSGWAQAHGYSLPDWETNFQEWYGLHVSDENKVHGGSGHERASDYVVDNIIEDDDGITFTPDLQNTLNVYINDFIIAHPTSYSMQNIYPSSSISSTYFQNATQYNAFLNAIADVGNQGYNFIFIPRYTSKSFTSSSKNFFFWNNGNSYSSNDDYSRIFGYYVGDSSKVVQPQFYCSAGHVNNYNYLASFVPTYNWTVVSKSNSSNNSNIFYNDWKFKAVTKDGNIIDIYKFSFITDVWGTISNSNLTTNTSGIALFNTSNRIMPIFLYDSIDAIRLHDSGQPSPYYVLPGASNLSSVYTDNSTFSYSSILNNSNSYTQITETITTGISGDELVQIIQTIVNDNSDAPAPTPPPSGGGGSDDSGDSIWDKLFGSLGDLIGGIINGILNIIARVIDGITSIVDSITNAITMLLDNTFSEQGTIFQFLKLFFEWLPEPIPQLLTSLFVISVIFAVIKLIKGAF